MTSVEESLRRTRMARLSRVNSSSRLLKNPPFASGLVGLVGFLGLVVERFEFGGPLAAGLEVRSAACGHHVVASAMSLGSLTRL